MENGMIKIITVEGPTASGKTALGIALAEKYGGEIVSADSMQIYKHMDIGSAKPTTDEQKAVPHHMIDIVDPTVNYSLNDYVTAARKVIADIESRGKIPILTGGTGLYINTLINNIAFTDEKPNPDLRKELEEYAEKFGNDALHARLAKIDPEAAENIHMNNVKRVVRAIEIYENTGITMTEQIRRSKSAEKIYKAYEYGICYDREILYDRINRRVDTMLESGLVDEVKYCLKLGCTRENTSMQGIGYKEVIDFIEEKCDFETMTERIKQESRRYAKRQITWFKRNNITWLVPGEIPDINFTEEDDMQ